MSAFFTDDHTFRSLIRIHGLNGIWVLFASAAFAVSVLCAAKASVLYHAHPDLGSGFAMYRSVGKCIDVPVDAGITEDLKLLLFLLSGQSETIQLDAHVAAEFAIPFRSPRQFHTTFIGVEK